MNNEISIRLRLAADQLRAGLQQVGASFNEVRSTINQLGDAAGPVGTVLSGLAAAFSVREILAANVAYESLTKSLAAITGTASAAAADLEFLKKTASTLGLETSTLSQSWVSFAASTKGTAVEGEKARAIFTAVAGSMAMLGKSSADTDRAITALSQMFSKGVVSMEEMRGQLGEALPGAMAAAAKGAGVTVAELGKMIETGTVLAEDLLPLMGQELVKQFGVGAAPVETLGAEINRLKNAVNEFLIMLGPVASAAYSTFSSTVRVALGIVGSAYIAFETLGKTLANVGYTLATLDFKGFAARQAQAADDMVGKWEKMRASLGFTASAANAAEAALNKSGVAADTAGEKAAGGAFSWLGLNKAYADVTTATGEYIKKSKAAAEANDAQAKTLVELAKLSGDDVRIKQAQSAAAVIHAAGLAKQAEAAIADEAATRAEIAALKDYVKTSGDTSKAHADELVKLEQTAAGKADATKKAQALAESARLEAVAAKLATDTYGDQSAKVGELRAAHIQAKAALDALIESQKQGKATADQVKAAQEAEAIALAKLKDALKDATAAEQLKLDAAGRNAKLSEQAIEIRIAEQRAIEASAKARGDEQGAIEAANTAKDLEIAKAKESAFSKQLEAEAALALAEAKKAELLASGEITAAKQAEIQASFDAAAAKQNEATLARNTAIALEQNAIAAENARAATEGLSKAVSEGTTLTQMWQGEVSKITETLNQLSPAAREAWDGVKTGTVDATEAVRNYADQLVALGQSNQALATSWGSVFSKMQLDGAAAIQNWLAQKDAADAYGQRIAGLGVDANNLAAVQGELANATSAVNHGFNLLDGENLSGLTAAIDATKNRMRVLQDQIAGARDALRGMADSAEEAVLRAQGKTIEILQRQHAAELAAVQSQLKVAGNDPAAQAEAERARRALEQKFAIDLAAAQADASAEKERAAKQLADQVARDTIDRAKATAVQNAVAPTANAQSTSSATSGAVQTLKLQAPDGSTTSISGTMDVDAILRTLKAAGLNVANI